MVYNSALKKYTGVLAMKIRCMLCGKPIEEEVVSPDPFDEDDDDMPKKKPLAVCFMCEAKLKHEADDSQKIPRPV